MKRLIEFPTEDGGSLFVEVDDDSRLGSGSTLRGGSGAVVVEKARLTYEDAVDNIRGAAETIVQKIKSLPHPPNEITVDFGIKLSADIGAILASAAAEAQFTLHLTWKLHPVPVVEVIEGSQQPAPSQSSGDEDTGDQDA